MNQNSSNSIQRIEHFSQHGWVKTKGWKPDHYTIDFKVLKIHDTRWITSNDRFQTVNLDKIDFIDLAPIGWQGLISWIFNVYHITIDIGDDKIELKFVKGGKRLYKMIEERSNRVKNFKHYDQNN